MAFDRGLEARLLEFLQEREDLVVKRMFGGLCFLLSKHMCCGIIGNKLMARIESENYEYCLSKPYTKEMDFTGKAIKSMVYVLSDGFESDDDLASWVNICTTYADSLPSKQSKPSKKYKYQ